jgi:ribosomal protein S18 acetylase RimI-like enzyme
MFTIVPASPADVPAVASALGSAFREDTVMSTLVAGGDRTRALTRLFHALLRSGALRHGRVDVARHTADGTVLGAAIWQRPGESWALTEELRELPQFVRALGAAGIAGALRTQRRIAAHRPSEPHWYLAQIGTTESARGTGVGSALLRHRLDHIDTVSEAAYLESSNERNRTLYRRFGFVTVGMIAGIPNANPARMWRAATLPARITLADTGTRSSTTQWCEGDRSG